MPEPKDYVGTITLLFRTRLERMGWRLQEAPTMPSRHIREIHLVDGPLIRCICIAAPVDRNLLRAQTADMDRDNYLYFEVFDPNRLTGMLGGLCSGKSYIVPVRVLRSKELLALKEWRANTTGETGLQKLKVEFMR